MPTWGEILTEFQHEIDKHTQAPFDVIRRRYLASAFTHTHRNTILYATKFTQDLPPGISLNSISLCDEDLQAAMEVVHGLKGPNLDLIIHSPGGSAESTEALVSYLRSKFDHIRAIIPSLAMSAATMLACSADVIVMGKHSFLGPIDPQFRIVTPVGERMVPAQAVIDQFEKAKNECQDTAKLAAWIPMLQQYGPDLLVQCENAIVKSREMVETWLRTYMFRSDCDGALKASQIATWLGDHTQFRSHSRHIPRAELVARGIKIQYLESDETEQDLFLSIFHAATHVFTMSGAVKLVENHEGRAFIKSAQMAVQQIPQQAGIPTPTPQNTPRC